VLPPPTHFPPHSTSPDRGTNPPSPAAWRVFVEVGGVHHAVPGEKVQAVVGRSSRPSTIASPGDSSRCSSARLPIFPQELSLNCGALSVFHASHTSSPHSSRSKASKVDEHVIACWSMPRRLPTCHCVRLTRTHTHARVRAHSWSPRSILPAAVLVHDLRGAEPPSPRSAHHYHVLGRECRETGYDDLSAAKHRQLCVRERRMGGC
jgi:hypothetical protein